MPHRLNLRVRHTILAGGDGRELVSPSTTGKSNLRTASIRGGQRCRPSGQITHRDGTNNSDLTAPSVYNALPRQRQLTQNRPTGTVILTPESALRCCSVSLIQSASLGRTVVA